MPGSVAVAAVNNWNEILLLRQYKHPVRMNLWEVPAGLLDITGEDPLHAAQRELAEEADLGADRWHSLVDYYTTPGALRKRAVYTLPKTCTRFLKQTV